MAALNALSNYTLGSPENGLDHNLARAYTTVTGSQSSSSVQVGAEEGVAARASREVPRGNYHVGGSIPATSLLYMLHSSSESGGNRLALR